MMRPISPKVGAAEFAFCGGSDRARHGGSSSGLRVVEALCAEPTTSHPGAGRVFCIQIAVIFVHVCSAVAPTAPCCGSPVPPPMTLGE